MPFLKGLWRLVFWFRHFFFLSCFGAARYPGLLVQQVPNLHLIKRHRGETQEVAWKVILFPSWTHLRDSSDCVDAKTVSDLRLITQTGYITHF